MLFLIHAEMVAEGITRSALDNALEHFVRELRSLVGEGRRNCQVEYEYNRASDRRADISVELDVEAAEDDIVAYMIGSAWVIRAANQVRGLAAPRWPAEPEPATRSVVRLTFLSISLQATQE